ncbi:hypothetical protein ACIQ9L_44215, partial [Streptomyces sp. NPDC094468]
TTRWNNVHSSSGAIRSTSAAVITPDCRKITPAEMASKYTVDWVADKLRWRLSADPAEVQALDRLAEQCPNAAVTYQ